MDCDTTVFSGHALRRMFERAISRDAVLRVVRQGETIANYPADQPYPSRLLLGFVSQRAIHVVVAEDPDARTCYVVTAYDPDPALWEPDFRRRKQP